jgi:ATP-dependent RNA helicase RhlE
MTFNDLNLNKPLLNALEDLGLSTPTTIQAKAFSVIMAGKDVCGLAQTGTGKTFAYLLPCLRLYQFAKKKTPQLLIIVPTRELVVQVVEQIEKLSKYMSLVAVGVYGGVNLKPQAAQVMEGADVLVGTPGRLNDLLLLGAFKGQSIKKLVIDEFDEMLNLGFRAQLKNIFDALPDRRQNLLFSATLTEEVNAVIEDYFPELVRIEAAPMGTPLSNIDQSRYSVPNFFSKLNLLRLLLLNNPEMNKVLVFTSTKSLADRIFEFLNGEWSLKVQVIHSNKSQPARFAAVNAFQAGECRVLIATDVIARGLDVSEVSHVFNFDMPDTPENYIHRIGRTGRVDKKGISISFVTPKEMELLAATEELMNFSIPELPLPEDLVLSEQLLLEEQPQINMKTIQVKITQKKNVGPAFHEKSDKNKKVNVKRDYQAEMKKKYGKQWENRKKKD